MLMEINFGKLPVNCVKINGNKINNLFSTFVEAKERIKYIFDIQQFSNNLPDNWDGKPHRLSNGSVVEIVQKRE